MPSQTLWIQKLLQVTKMMLNLNKYQIILNVLAQSIFSQTLPLNEALTILQIIRQRLTLKIRPEDVEEASGTQKFWFYKGIDTGSQEEFNKRICSDNVDIAMRNTSGISVQKTVQGCGNKVYNFSSSCFPFFQRAS